MHHCIVGNHKPKEIIVMLEAFVKEMLRVNIANYKTLIYQKVKQIRLFPTTSFTFLGCSLCH